MKEQLEEKYGPCGKLLFYFKQEFNYDPYDLVKMFDVDFELFMYKMKEKNLLDPQSISSEKNMKKEIDDFMIDMKQYNKRRDMIIYKI